MKLETKISRHAKDIIQKYTSSLFQNATLDFYGIKTAKIKELINVELPVIEVSASSTDYIFLLEDNSYLHLEFQTAYNKKDLVRFAAYDLRLFERDGRKVETVIIYPADVKEAVTSLNIGSLMYNPSKVLMHGYDGNAIYSELENKITAGAELADADMLNLIFLPLMRSTIEKDELAIQSIKLANTITDRRKRDTCIASVFAFAHGYLNENNIDRILEVLRMTDLATMLIEDAISDKAIEIAKNAIQEGLTIGLIAKLTGLDEQTIKQLQDKLNNE